MGFTTQLLHSDRRFGVEHGNLLKPIHPGVTYGYEDAHDLARVFQGKQKGYTYGRQINPTVEALEQKITQMENGLATIALSTGMAAIGTTLFDATCADAVAAAVQSNTKLVFVETIANPRTQVSDLVGIGAVCKAQGLIYVVDNTLTTPFLFQPKSVGACLVINSLTKYIGGHGNALGGSVTEMGQFDWTTFANIHDGYRVGEPSMWGLNQIKKKGLRDFGASLAADSAHRLSTGADTLALRMPRACDNASALAAFFQDHDLIDAVYYPGLPDHPQHQRTARLFGRPGAILSIELQPRIDCFRFLNQLQTVIKATHLGDIRTLAIPVAHSIFYEIGPARRAEMDIKDNLIRFSVGIEEIEDLLDDFDQALSSQS